MARLFKPENIIPTVAVGSLKEQADSSDRQPEENGCGQEGSLHNRSSD
jgi:hypothetical protein